MIAVLARMVPLQGLLHQSSLSSVERLLPCPTPVLALEQEVLSLMREFGYLFCLVILLLIGWCFFTYLFLFFCFTCVAFLKGTVPSMGNRSCIRGLHFACSFSILGRQLAQ
jgi:hypothetical protein